MLKDFLLSRTPVFHIDERVVKTQRNFNFNFKKTVKKLNKNCLINRELGSLIQYKLKLVYTYLLKLF